MPMLSGYSDDKTRFEKMLALYKKNASKFSTSEINDLNEVFELGKEFFDVDVELPVVKKEVANGLERDPLRPNFQKDLLKLVGEEFNCQAYWESKNPKPFETVSVQDAKYLEARWDNTGKTIGIRVKLPTKQFVDIQYIMNAVNREEVYAQFSEKFKKILDKMGIGENLTIYPTTYGIGTFIAFGNRGNIGKKLNEVLDKAGISYTNEYSDAHYVYRYKISKSQENIKKLDKFLQDASLNDSLSGYSDDKTRFETMLALYKKNASKFSTSEINDLNEVFELGKEFFDVDVELPVVKKQKKFVCAPTRNTTVETPQRSIPAVYSIVELTDLITSNTPHNFKPDPRYPDKCQQRDYLTDKSEQEKVRVGAKHFNPAIVINNAPTASDGPAIVNNKHFVLGGNGRTMMMKLLSKEKYSEYLDKLKCDLDIFGLTANDLKGYIQPCLVREVDMKVQECALFSNILNQNLTQDIDLVTKTVSFARQLSETDIKHIAMLFENTDSDTLASMLSDKKVVSKLQEIFRSAGIITAQNTSKWLVDSHIFTNEGKLATEGILLGTVLENKNLIEAARSFTEKIIRTIPLLLRMKNLPKEWNMIDDIQNVVKLEYERRKMNVPIDDYIDQISFDKPDVKEKEELVWKVIAEGSWLKWKNFLDKYVKMGEDAQELEASGGGMFGETVKPMDAIRRLSGMKNSLNDLLSGYSDDKTRFETMLALYKKNASKFSTSEIKDLNEVFELGKEFFDVDVELPKGETKKKAGKIEKYEDYGEKIGGAKKDLYHRMEELKQLSSDDFINLPLSKTFPKPDYVQLYKDGILTHDGAFALKFMYEAIAKKPRQSYKQAKWAKQVRSVIEIMTDTLFNNKSVIPGTQFNKSYKLLKALGFPNVDVNLDGYDIAQWVTDKKRNPATGELEHYISKYNREKVNSDGTKGAFEDTFIPESETKYYGVTKGSETVISFHTYEEAVEFLKSRLSIGTSKPTNDKKVEFNIYRSNIGTKQIFIGKKMATGVVDFSVGIEFKTVGEARKYLNEKYDEVLQRFNDLKINFQERRSTNRPRVGKDWRNGENITPEKFAKTFGFRGIEFGNWVNSAERQMHINEAYEALMDLSFATGLPAGAIALNGELGLAFGARGSGNANAHYEPEKIVINLTKTRGSGSLAHEWFHALDNYFSRVRGYKHDYITEKAYPHMDKSTGKLSVAVRQEIIDSFKALHDVLRKSDLHKRSEKLDSTRSKLYWSTGIEMGARCFENYVVDTLEKSGITNDYLSNFKEEWQWEKDYKQGSYPYPSEEESPIFNSTYQKIFDTIETKKHEEKDVLALSDSYDQPQQSFPTIPSGVGCELGNLFARAPQRSFVRLMQNAGVANVAIRLLRQQNIITDANKSAWITDSVTFTPNGITLLKEGLWKLLFPHTLTSDYPEQVTDKILKNLSAFLQLKSNGTLFLQFEIALELGKDWNNDGRTFEEYCSATVFDNPLDAQEFAVLCPILWEMNNDKFDYILQQYVKSYSQSDRATFLRNLSTEIGTRVSRQKTHSLSDVYIWK